MSIDIGNVGIPNGATLNIQTGTAAAAALTVTLPAVTGRVTYISGFSVSGLGATTATNIVVNIGVLANGSALNFDLAIPAGITTIVPVFLVTFPFPLAGNGAGSLINVSVPSFGAGNTLARANAWGFLL